MLAQLSIGTILICITSLVAALSIWGLELALIRSHRWVVRPPYGSKLIISMMLAMLWSVLLMTASVWIWAATFWILGIFATVEESVYFSLVSFTTLGFGDILLPREWRLLGGLAAANGLLVFGLLTVMMIETLRQVRLKQQKKTR